MGLSMGLSAVSESIKRNTVNYECIRLDCKVDWGSVRADHVVPTAARGDGGGRGAHGRGRGAVW